MKFLLMQILMKIKNRIKMILINIVKEIVIKFKKMKYWEENNFKYRKIIK
jgi:hypothetical protein